MLLLGSSIHFQCMSQNLLLEKILNAGNHGWRGQLYFMRLTSNWAKQRSFAGFKSFFKQKKQKLFSASGCSCYGNSFKQILDCSWSIFLMK